jgi:hypothetical protein
MATRYCPSCGTPVENGGAFCPSCGTSIGAAQPAQQASAPPQPVGQPQPAQTWTAPAYTNAPLNNDLDAPLSVGQYLGMLILLGIPIVGLVLVLMWAFGSNVNQNKKNYARATLILGIIVLVLAIALSSVLSIFMSEVFSSFNQGY